MLKIREIIWKKEIRTNDVSYIWIYFLQQKRCHKIHIKIQKSQIFWELMFVFFYYSIKIVQALKDHSFSRAIRNFLCVCFLFANKEKVIFWFFWHWRKTIVFFFHTFLCWPFFLQTANLFSDQKQVQIVGRKVKKSWFKL